MNRPRTCYVCERSEFRGAKFSDAHGCCNDCAAARVHVVSMTIDWVTRYESYSVATCQCGWSNRMRRDREGFYTRQNAIVRGHWMSVIKGAAA